MTTARVIGISRHRLTTDGDGVTTLVAFNGCPLRCRYCLNKFSWEPTKGREYTPESLYEEVKIDQLYFLATKGGVTFGGGEPLLQVDFIKEFRALCGPQWSIIAESSLNVSVANLEAVNTVLDGYIIDIKDMNPDVYKAYTGKDNAIVVQNLRWILERKGADKIKVRIPHIKDYNTDDDVKKSIETLRKMGFTDLDEFEYVIR